MIHDWFFNFQLLRADRELLFDGTIRNYSEFGIELHIQSWFSTFTFKVSHFEIKLMWTIVFGLASVAHQPNFTCETSSHIVHLLCNLHLKFLCSLDPQQLPCVEDSERLLTTCMLQVVSTLTLRSIKNTGMHINFFSCPIFLLNSLPLHRLQSFYVSFIYVMALKFCCILH